MPMPMPTISTSPTTNCSFDIRILQRDPDEESADSARVDLDWLARGGPESEGLQSTQSLSGSTAVEHSDECGGGLFESLEYRLLVRHHTRGEVPADF